ncbi:MAG: hypothetical protein WC401_09780 [Bacteroidales bacterium]|jgi:hypothetical protein
MENILNLQEERIKDITVRGYKFKIRYMSPMDRVQIAQQRMMLQNGNPVTALTDSDFIFFENIAIVNICVDEMPKEFKEGESCIKWEDIELINEVANEIRTYTNSIEEKLKKNRPIIGGK